MAGNLITPNSSQIAALERERDIYYMIISRAVQCSNVRPAVVSLRSMRYIHICESYSIMKVPRAPAYTIHRVVCALSTWVSVIAKLSILTQL